MKYPHSIANIFMSTLCYSEKRRRLHFAQIYLLWRHSSLNPFYFINIRHHRDDRWCRLQPGRTLLHRIGLSYNCLLVFRFIGRYLAYLLWPWFFMRPTWFNRSCYSHIPPHIAPIQMCRQCGRAHIHCADPQNSYAVQEGFTAATCNWNTKKSKWNRQEKQMREPHRSLNQTGFDRHFIHHSVRAIASLRPSADEWNDVHIVCVIYYYMLHVLTPQFFGVG